MVHGHNSLLLGTTTKQAGFDNQIIVEGPNPVLMLKDNTGGNQATQFHTVFSSNGAIKQYFDHEKSFSIAHTTDVIGNNENVMMKIDGSNVEFPYANTKISGSATSTGSFGHGFIANNLGVGTTSPVRMLDIVGAGAAIKVDSSDNAYIELDRGAASNLSQVRYLTAGSAKWYAGLTDSDVSGFDGTEFFIGEGSGGASDAHFVIDGDGNIGIGVTDPTRPLTVVRPDGSNSGDYMASFLNSDTTSDQGHGILVQAGNDDGDISFIVS